MDTRQRLARFSALEALPIMRDKAIPREALDIVYARRLLPVIGLDGEKSTPINEAAPIVGAGGITMTFAVCPPGQGPELHTHHETWETFTVMKGRFRFIWGNQGEEFVELDPFDVLSIPPGVCRAFRNVSDEEAVVQVVISGGVHDMNDIDWPSTVARRVADACGGDVEPFRSIGMVFE